MTIDQLIKDITEKLMELPDLTGMARCAGFYLVYRGFQTLKQQIEAENQNHTEEILALKAEIQDLKILLEGKGIKENGPEHE